MNYSARLTHKEVLCKPDARLNIRGDFRKANHIFVACLESILMLLTKVFTISS